MNRAAEFLARRADLALVGLRGAGKSALGRAVAVRLGREFVDSDERIAADAGQSIAEIFRTRSEFEFRALEAQVIAALLTAAGRVIALGGGSILNAQTRGRLAERALVVWLQASAPVLRGRVARDALTPEQRPSLTGGGVLDEIAVLQAQRAPLYRAAANLVLDTTALEEQQAAGALLELVRSAAASPPR